MPIKSISTQKAGQALDGTHFLQLSATPVLIFDIEGETDSTTGTDYFIQLHGSVPSSGVTVPLYSRLCVSAAASTGKNGFSFIYRPIGLDTSTMFFPSSATVGGSNALPVYVAISSTDNVYTSVAASTHVTVDIEDTYLEQAGQAITGDLTTGRDSLAVWTDPNAAKRLLQFTAINGTGADAYIMLFASNVANGILPIQQWKVLNGATLVCRFNNGLGVQQLDTTPTLHTGCYLFGSSTTQTLTKTVASGWNIQAYNI